MAVGELVTIVNRTAHPLFVKMNGRERAVPPGESQITSEWIKFAKLQNPRRGTFTPGTIEGDYLIGVKGKDDCNMLSPDEEHLNEIENFDRSGEAARGNEVINTRTGERPPRRMVMEDAPSLDGGFLKGR